MLTVDQSLEMIERALLRELKQPLKRRIGMRFPSEFYFVTPANLVKHAEIQASGRVLHYVFESQGGTSTFTPDAWPMLRPRTSGYTKMKLCFANSAFGPGSVL